MSLQSDVQFKKEPNAIINKFMGDLSSFLEAEIQAKYETMQLYKKIINVNPNDLMAQQQVESHVSELHMLIKQLIDVRKDNDFTNPATKPIVDELENIESFCPDCGEFKKKEQVTLSGPFDRAKIKKKKKKPEVAQIPRGFELFELCEHKGKELLREVDFDAFTHSSSFIGNVRYDNDSQEMKIILCGKEYDFCTVPRRQFDGFEGATSKGKFFNDEIKGHHDC